MRIRGGGSRSNSSGGGGVDRNSSSKVLSRHKQCVLWLFMYPPRNLSSCCSACPFSKEPLRNHLIRISCCCYSILWRWLVLFRTRQPCFCFLGALQVAVFPMQLFISPHPPFIYLPLEVIIYWHTIWMQTELSFAIQLPICLLFLSAFVILTRGLIRNEILIYSRMVTSDRTSFHIFYFIILWSPRWRWRWRSRFISAQTWSSTSQPVLEDIAWP